MENLKDSSSSDTPKKSIIDAEIIRKIEIIKRRFIEDGFVIEGVFGSFARGEEGEDSDIDIIFSCTDVSFAKYPGLRFFSLYERVKKELESELNRKVDLVDKNGLSEIGRKYILPEVVYVS
jgi:predicted nucleotidyltransferase